MQQSPHRAIVPAVSLRDMLKEWYESVELPKIVGHHMHFVCTKVREGEQHGASALQHIIDDMTARGLPLETKLGAVRVMETYVRATHPVRPAAVDLASASLREEHASARVNPLQMRAMNPNTVSDVDLDRLDAWLGEQIEATAEYREQVRAEKARRVAGRTDAMRRLA